MIILNRRSHTSIWPVGQVVKTPPSQGGITSSTLVQATNLVYKPLEIQEVF